MAPIIPNLKVSTQNNLAFSRASPYCQYELPKRLAPGVCCRVMTGFSSESVGNEKIQNRTRPRCSSRIATGDMSVFLERQPTSWHTVQHWQAYLYPSFPDNMCLTSLDTCLNTGKLHIFWSPNQTMHGNKGAHLVGLHDHKAGALCILLGDLLRLHSLGELQQPRLPLSGSWSAGPCACVKLYVRAQMHVYVWHTSVFVCKTDIACGCHCVRVRLHVCV